MARHLINPKQSSDVRIYNNQKNEAVIVHKDGVIFSDDKEMDATVEFFKKEYGFVEKKVQKKVEEVQAEKAKQ